MRSKYNILAVPYNKKNGNISFCILKREDLNIWQFVAGGGEEFEQPLETAKREIKEEIGFYPNYIQKLDTIGSVSVEFFKDFKDLWKEHIYVIPIYTFFFEISNREIQLSNEHIDYKWVNYKQAFTYLHFDLDKTALWESSKRIENMYNKD
ncbi:NUDIX pyrophosphatase [Macrococcoides caseolyticum]|uniref:NUDIX hydrolase n=1 Tax=Macrococcoides caseolyticum TaxID=69966 RepID=UPI000C33364C|nr:NUDIX domain-containing protein [Macrococcus caseolyticus]PKE05741.1 NUDIX pyrophosphatase [Macrococcus caseolyticus]PKE22881.1 NUDIX pyrophosphatase [Macrococcus caseolyticus]PKE51212.1 NUDIX pyrophosphatase [Macrococcus caseolyticus]PKF37597.1 NUDIX pyrophosphatase [Macrococcus caseolyticus]